jgi:hypothetical protein
MKKITAKMEKSIPEAAPLLAGLLVSAPCDEQTGES